MGHYARWGGKEEGVWRHPRSYQTYPVDPLPPKIPCSCSCRLSRLLRPRSLSGSACNGWEVHCVTRSAFDRLVSERIPIGDGGCGIRSSSRVPRLSGENTPRRWWSFTWTRLPRRRWSAKFLAKEVAGVVVPQTPFDRMRATTTEEHGQAMGIGIAQELVEKVWDAAAGIAVGALLGAIATAFAVLGKHRMSVA